MTMKTYSGWLLAGVASVALAGVSSAQASGVPVVKLCHENEDSYPWLFKDRVGLTTSLLKMAEKSSGVKLEIQPLPWKRCLEEAKAGTIDGVIKISFAADRTDFLAYPMAADKPDASKRLLSDSYSLYRMKGSNAATWDGKVLKAEGSVGAQSGFSIVKTLTGLGAKVDDAVRSADTNLLKLANGRLAAVALQTEEGDISIATNPELSGKVEKVSPVLVEKPYFVTFSKPFYAREAATAKKIWDAIEAARESAEYQDLAKKFK